jgi:hypothetical protein
MLIGNDYENTGIGAAAGIGSGGNCTGAGSIGPNIGGVVVRIFVCAPLDHSFNCASEGTGVNDVKNQGLISPKSLITTDPSG